ncbi:MAG: bifunctional proline dehydrogenase/L-glutamate gamma-semialdehyde dehydrogenase PutA [Gammaproteobacteria bacterium]|nr:bifunctional proline dehydrogenase/L-glutamate gamma-semialdehyde dehydrogenase PutA [Gammaproteobacteria bacterium]MYC25620.1 bifunctional proline dehydrogenase/L-glutamate gamma-semialdehyde dehydrogenase PutA [Gammaproteobacteria bacterium]
MSELHSSNSAMNSLDESFVQISRNLLRSENEVVRELLKVFAPTQTQTDQISKHASALVSQCRSRKHSVPFVEKFLHRYGLSSDEGVALLSLVEALLRVPDKRTADILTLEKFQEGNWGKHTQKNGSMLVSLATLMMEVTSRIFPNQAQGNIDKLDKNLSSVPEAGLRRVMLAVVNFLALAFVSGSTIQRALARAKEPASFDMLGEGARTFAAADRYFESYKGAIDAIATNQQKKPALDHSLSVKLTALYPKVHPLNESEAVDELFSRAEQLCVHAASANLNVTIDAEESDRCDINLRVVEKLLASSKLKDWDGLGVVVQAYAKRAVSLVDWLADLATQYRTKLKVRLVKGAYWDAEIKIAQVNGFEAYPVFTRKENTDLCFLACIPRLFKHADRLFPQFATHNAHTIATVCTLAQGQTFEFQRLYGMGELLYEEVARHFPESPKVRVYSPVGVYEDLVPYLMRRLLENGATSNFVYRIFNEELSVADVSQNPRTKVLSVQEHQHPKIPLPIDIYGEQRSNSIGVDFGNEITRSRFREQVESWLNNRWSMSDTGTVVKNPANSTDEVGSFASFEISDIDPLLTTLSESVDDWSRLEVADRCQRIEKWADAIHEHRPELTALLQREAGKTVEDAVTELREAEDFCRYYAAEARTMLEPQELPSPTGESNHLLLCPRGLFVCISPWNFPASIFVGPIAAALVTGNTVAAKPAPQTSLIALRLSQLAIESAGIPPGVFAILPGGDDVGKELVANPRVNGVAFTGSETAARAINRTLAAKESALTPLIAETGGVNVMIVDSTAQFEHATDDIIHSAFKSAGQRCSALRLLCVQDEIADALLEMICGAIDTLKLGDPTDWSVDVGPVIDPEAKQRLEDATTEYEVLHSHQSDIDADGYFVRPTIVNVEDITKFNSEHFGPILGFHRYQRGEVANVIDQANALGYGLTFGVHSRLNSTIERFTTNMKVGNMYVNRTMTGAVVGTQPFGGEGLSGTGPKAGGALYLTRFVVERVVTRNETATGGNLTLMKL